jgi:hypothetical protein
LYTNLYYSYKQGSKGNWVMNSIKRGWPKCVPGNRNQPALEPSHFWGMLYNEQTIRYLTTKNVDWYFWDMPYYKRYGLFEDFMWRVSCNSLHYSRTRDWPSDRFERWSIEPQSYSTGSKILICPSSETMTRWYTGMDVKMWVKSITTGLKKYTDRPIEVRYKPRARGTSGPTVADVPFEEQAQNTHCVVTLCSLAAVEAQLLGIPTMCHPQSFAADISITQCEDIENLVHKDTHQWFFNLAYSQFTHAEIESGLARECLQHNV